MKLSEQIIRLAQQIKELDVKLYNMKSKQGVKNYIYKKIHPLTKGFFNDTDWSNVQKVFDAVYDLGVDFTWWVKDGGYEGFQCKKYNFNIKFTNIEGKTFDFDGLLTCSFCGTVDDPMSRYDMIFQLF